MFETNKDHFDRKNEIEIVRVPTISKQTGPTVLPLQSKRSFHLPEIFKESYSSCMHHKIILMNYCFVSTLEIAYIFVTFYLMAIQRGVALLLLHEKLEFEKSVFKKKLGHGSTLLPLFSKCSHFQ